MHALGWETRVLAVGCNHPGAQSVEVNGHVRARYLGEAESAVYVIRPDQVVAARFVDPAPGAVEAAVAGIYGGA